MKTKTTKKRILSLLLCAILLCGFAPVGIASAAASEGLCEHHTEHTEDCGYSVGTEAGECTYAHNENCGYSEEPDFMSGLTELETTDDMEAIAAELNRLYDEKIIDFVGYEALSSVSLDEIRLFSRGPINDSETYSFTGAIDPIVVESGSPTIILNDVTITAINTPAIWIKAGATVNLQLEGANHLTGGAGYAAICVNPAYTNDGYAPDGSAKLIVSGSGGLTANGGNGDPSNGMFGGGAGIGSGGFDCANFDWKTVCGRINIHNGTVIANDSLENEAVGAGIGSGTGGLTQAWYTDFSDIMVAITGGDIVAQGGVLSAGIGGGSLCDGGNVNISGGTVVAKAGAADGPTGASGIGGGNDGGVLYRIDIMGGRITAIASGGSAGIGGASNTSYSNLQYGDMNGARSDGKIGVINISGQDTIVNAYGGTADGSSGTFGGAGIGAGYPVANNARSVAFDIFMQDGATVNAYGGYHAQAIGYGYRPGSHGQYYTGYGIKLALDDTISLWAQNYDFFQPALVVTTEYDDNPITYKSDDKYLVSYVDENQEAAAATSSEAKGCLEWGNEQTAQSLAWGYAENKLSINGYEIGTVDNMNGNWATLYSAPKITVSYAWTTENNPTDVTAPANDVIETGTEYTAKEQSASMQGYRFDGWYADEGCTQAYQNGSVTVMENAFIRENNDRQQFALCLRRFGTE